MCADHTEAAQQIPVKSCGKSSDDSSVTAVLKGSGRNGTAPVLRVHVFQATNARCRMVESVRRVCR